MGRKDGILHVDIRCSDELKTVRVPIFFSFKIRETGEEEGESEKRFIAESFSPPKVMSFLKDKEFFILKDPMTSRLIKARIVDFIDDKSCFLEISDEQMVDKRSYDRFTFCPEEFGEFQIRRGGELYATAKILDISISGLKLLLKEEKDFSVGDSFIVSQGTKILNVQIIRLEDSPSGKILGARITSANFNIVNFIIGNYVDVVKKLLS